MSDRLPELLKFCRDNKVTRLKTPDGYELELSPDALLPEELPNEAASDPKLDETGANGQTRREQIELFGRIYEEDFQRKV